MCIRDSYAAAFAYLLLRGETRGLRFDGKRALLLVGLLALALSLIHI